MFTVYCTRRVSWPIQTVTSPYNIHHGLFLYPFDKNKIIVIFPDLISSYNDINNNRFLSIQMGRYRVSSGHPFKCSSSSKNLTIQARAREREKGCRKVRGSPNLKKRSADRGNCSWFSILICSCYSSFVKNYSPRIFIVRLFHYEMGCSFSAKIGYHVEVYRMRVHSHPNLLSHSSSSLDQKISPFICSNDSRFI